VSTISKLDPNVRLDRYLRKQMLRDMRKDVGTASDLIARGARVGVTKLGGTLEHKKLMSDLVLKRAVLAMTLDHLTKICRSPYRSGAAKEAILAKLAKPLKEEQAWQQLAAQSSV
jgi:hypothetical protein